MKKYLQPTFFIDSDHNSIREFVEATAGEGTAREKAVRLYYAVRDQVKYNPYLWSLDKGHYRASFVLSQKVGFCVQKAILLAAVTRAVGIPARPGFANVRNHLSTQHLRELMKTDVFVFHGYTEIFLGDKWVKSTPAFDKSLCERFGVFPLDFDGRSDSIFHPLDRSGRKHMEYLHDYGTFDDFPFDMMIRESMKHYPHLVEAYKERSGFAYDFEKEE